MKDLRTVRLSKTKWGTLCQKIRKKLKGPVLNEKLLKKSFFFDVAFYRTTSPYLNSHPVIMGGPWPDMRGLGWKSY